MDMIRNHSTWALPGAGVKEQLKDEKKADLGCFFFFSPLANFGD